MTAATLTMRPSRWRVHTASAWQSVRRVAPLGTILLLHVAFFYALQSGLLHQAAVVLPKEVSVRFVAPQTAPERPKPQPLPERPRTVPVVKKQVVSPPPVPVVNTTPSPDALAVAPSPSAPAEPASPAVSAAPAPAAPSAPKTVTSGIEYLQPPQPEYPPVSRRVGEEGKAVLRVLVNDKGRPERVEVQKTSGFVRLDEAARQAVMRAIFKPFIDDGNAVPAYAIVPIRFQLDN